MAHLGLNDAVLMIIKNLVRAGFGAFLTPFLCFPQFCGFGPKRSLRTQSPLRQTFFSRAAFQAKMKVKNASSSLVQRAVLQSLRTQEPFVSWYLPGRSPCHVGGIWGEVTWSTIICRANARYAGVFMELATIRTAGRTARVPTSLPVWHNWMLHWRSCTWLTGALIRQKTVTARSDLQTSDRQPRTSPISHSSTR